jgi:DNA-binding NtrC family response regulator
VVVTDFRLGWSDGLVVLDRIKATWPTVPVIMFTNTGSEEICATGMKNGLARLHPQAPRPYPKVSHAVRVALEQAGIRRRLELQARTWRAAARSSR